MQTHPHSPTPVSHSRRPTPPPPTKSLRLLLSLAGAFAGLLLGPSAFAAYTDGPVLEFLDFNTFDPPTWTSVDGAAPVRGTSANPTMELANGVAKADLTPGLYDPTYDTYAPDGPVTTNWTLRFDARHSSRRRGLWAGLFNAAGTQGYAVLWDSAVSGTGHVTIRKFDLGSEAQWSDKGSALTAPASSGHDPLDSNPARIELSWDAPSHTLYLRVDGIPRAEVVDASFDSFSRIYVRGNTTSYFSNISVLSENPPSAAEIASAYNLVTDGGAVGDGITNDRGRILAAIAAARAAGLPLYVPPGVYAISDYILAQDIDIFGHGYVSAFRALNPDRRSVKFTGDGGSLTKLRLISATTTRNTGPASAAVSFVGATNFLVGHVFIEGANSAGIIAHTDASSAGEIAENWISNTLANGILLSTGANHITVAHNRIRNPGDHAVAVQTLGRQPTSHDVTITRNDIEALDTTGIEVIGSEVIVIDHNWIIASAGIRFPAFPWELSPSHDLSVIGNSIVATENEAIEVLGLYGVPTHNLSIQDNTLHSLSSIPEVIYMLAIDEGLVTGNRIEGGSHGVWFNGRSSNNITISNNDFVGNSSASIDMGNEDAYAGQGLLSIDGNQFSGLNWDPVGTGPAAVINLESPYAEAWETVQVTNNTWDEAPAAIDWFIYSDYPVDTLSGNAPSDRNYIGTGDGP